MSLPIPLVRSAEHTLQEQIYQFIRDQILGGVYKAGQQLPSTRDLAVALKVSRNTVVLAYDWLANEGYLTQRKYVGTFVCKVVPDTIQAQDVASHSSQLSGISISRARPTPVAGYRTPVLIGRTSRRPQVDFWYGRPDPRLFPMKIWRRLVADNLARAPWNYTEYGDQAGDLELRQVISEHLATSRGVHASSDRIVITSGAQGGLNLVCRLLITAGAEVAVEDPCYAAAATLFRSYGARLSPLEIDDEGVRPEALERVRCATLLYITPSHQFPTGAILSLARRQAVLHWADVNNAYVVEDDYDSEIIYDRPPLAALAALDRHRRVIYVGSFSKTIGAGIRVGYLVLPDELVEPALAAKSLSNYGQPWLDQAVLASFIKQGAFRNHLRRLRTLYRERRDTLMSGLRATFGGDSRISGHEAGLHLIWEVPSHLPDAKELSAIARSVGVGLYTLSETGALEFVASPVSKRRLVLGYAGLTPKEIEDAIARLRAALDRRTPRQQLLDEAWPDMPRNSTHRSGSITASLNGT